MECLGKITFAVYDDPWFVDSLRQTMDLTAEKMWSVNFTDMGFDLIEIIPLCRKSVSDDDVVGDKLGNQYTRELVQIIQKIIKLCENVSYCIYGNVVYRMDKSFIFASGIISIDSERDCVEHIQHSQPQSTSKTTVYCLAG